MNTETELEKKELNEQAKEQDQEDRLRIKDDRCPHCGADTIDFPYTMFDPLRGWLECCVCGVVFSPLSVRRQKLDHANARIKVPKLVLPV